VPLFSGECLLERVLLDVGRPQDQLVHLGEDGFDLRVGELRRQLKLVLCELQVLLGSLPADGLRLAEPAPRATGEFSIAIPRQLRCGLQNLVGPCKQVLLADLPFTDVLPPWLVDGHADRVDVVDIVEQFESTETVAGHLRIAFRRDLDAQTVFQIDDPERAIRDDQGVGGAEALLHPVREVHTLFNQNNRISACLLRILYLLQHVGDIAFRGLLHLLVVVVEALGRILRRVAERLAELEFGKRVSAGAFGGVAAAFILESLA